jgi:UDP-N-acetylmuramate--alanine ligase
MNLLSSFKKIFILGIGGSGMSSIAKYLKQKGHDVEGYDQRISYITNLLESDGVKTCQNLDNFKYQEDVLYVISSAINLEDTFLANYTENENVISRPKFLELLSEEVEILGITGTHGKTSTTALVSHIFHFNNKNASFIYGGVSGFGNLGGHFGEKTQPLILETDEAFNTFKNINIKDLIVTNIDNDHIDFYESYENLIDAFNHVIKNVKGVKVLNYDDENLRLISDKDIISYSRTQTSDYKINLPNSFEHEGKSYEVSTKLIGDHYLSNIVAAIAICNVYGISTEDSIKAISEFGGVKRRMEYIGTYNNTKFYDDYGHHPTEMKATISALKSITKGKLYVIFQPHRYTRTRDNFEAFQNSLNVADAPIVTDIYSAGEEPIPGVSSKNFSNSKIKYIKSIRSVPIFIKSNIKPGDNVLTLGAGDITLLGPQILKYLND